MLLITGSMGTYGFSYITGQLDFALAYVIHLSRGVYAPVAHISVFTKR